MPVFQNILPIRQFLQNCRKNEQSVGLVPTMGALHKGHQSLLEMSVQQNDVTVCSIFVNPAQFNDPTDLEKYPRDFEADQKLIDSVGPVIIFSPTVKEMYPVNPGLNISFGSMEKVMEGAFREDHFNGVAIVVSKLFNIIQPDRAYFGQKDFQQVSIIEKMVRDLNFGIEIVRVPTVREENGLAFSSRNLNIKPEDRENALLLYKSLEFARKALRDDVPITEVKSKVLSMFEVDRVKLDYFEIVAEDLKTVEEINSGDNIVICVAAHIGDVRLIDNMPLFD